MSIKQLVEDFARYLHLPRLAETKVLLDAISDGLSLLTWERDTFAYADSYDETSGRYIPFWTPKRSALYIQLPSFASIWRGFPSRSPPIGFRKAGLPPHP